MKLFLQQRFFNSLLACMYFANIAWNDGEMHVRLILLNYFFVYNLLLKCFKFVKFYRINISDRIRFKKFRQSSEKCFLHGEFSNLLLMLAILVHISNLKKKKFFYSKIFFLLVCFSDRILINYVRW